MTRAEYCMNAADCMHAHVTIPTEGAHVSLTESVEAGLAELEPLDVRDRATAELALKYAKGIDEPFDWGDRQRDPLAELGPKLLQALTALGMTPAARKSIVVDQPAPAPRNPLDELRRK